MRKRRQFIAGVVTASTITIAGCAGDEEGEPAFELRDVQSSPSITQSGDEITAAATVENVGEGSGTTTVEFSLDASQSTVESETIRPGDTTQLTTNIEIPLLDSERYDLTATLGGQESLSTPVDVYEELNESGLHGSVVSEVGESLEGSVVRFISSGQEFVDNNVDVDGTERFFSTHLKSLSYDLRATFLGNTNRSDFDEIPDIAPLVTSHTVTDDVEVLGQYAIPQGYRTDIQLVDENNNPVTNIQSVFVRDEIGNGVIFDLDGEGYLTDPERPESGVILPAQSTFDVDARPEGEDQPVIFGEVSGSPDGEEFVLEVPNPDQFATG